MSYHPKQLLLKQYARGEIDAVQGLTLAVHLESCPECRLSVAEFEAEMGQTLCAPLSGIGDDEAEFEQMFAQITAQRSHFKPSMPPLGLAKINVNNRSFVLPKSLAPFHAKIGPWRSYGGKIFSARIELGETSRVNLLYIAPGASVPQHTHKGLESTLVLHGSFSDEQGRYKAGDFLLKDATDKHSPSTSETQDCLCLSVLTEPMLFTKGVARVFNAFGKGIYP